MMEAGIKAFAENICDVRTLFRLRATCWWLKRVCDGRLALIRPDVPCKGTGGLLADLKRPERLMHYAGLPCVFDRAMRRLPRYITMTFLANYAKEVGRAVAAASSVRLVCRTMRRGEMLLATEFADGLLNKSDECVAEMYFEYPDVFEIGRELSRRLARITGIGRLREAMLFGPILKSPFRDVCIVEEYIGVLLEEWKREDGSREFVPLDAAITRRKAFDGAAALRSNLVEDFNKANPKAFCRYVTTHHRSI